VEQTVASRFILRWLLAPILLLWVYHLSFRGRAEKGEKKRFASLMLVVILLGTWAVTAVVSRLSARDVLLLPAFLAAAAVLYRLRKPLLPYRLSCARCGAPLPLNVILFRDSNECGACDGHADANTTTKGAPQS
jgi:8-oxo-dGTP diphosphatase